jgi:Tol biopolymer transport system component
MDFAGSSTWNRQLSADVSVPSVDPLRVLSDPSDLVTGQRSSIVIVDPTVKDYQQLIAGVQPNTDVIVLDPAQDAIAQITQSLLERTGISSLHFVSHGNAGTLQLGKTWLNLSSLDRYATAFKTWSQALAEDADILLYGCNIADGETGLAFLERFSQLTGSDIAASMDLTGGIGGDWILEINTGEIATSLAFTSETLNTYQHVLPVDLISVADPNQLSNANSVGIDSIGRNATSGDGRYSVFTSSASTLAEIDNNNQSDVFLYDRQTNTSTLISRNTTNRTTSAAGKSFNPVISYDGNHVAFISNANDLVTSTVANTTNADNIFVWERSSGDITLVSRDQSGKSGTRTSAAPSISDDGAFIAFQSQSQLANSDPNTRPDVYVWSRSNNSLVHVTSNRTSSSSRTQGAASPVISGDGNYVAFTSLYTNLSAIAEDGSVLADNNGQQDVFVWKRTTDEIINLTVKGRGQSTSPVINQDGSRVAFVSEASQFATDTNAASDVFVWSRSSPTSLAGTIQLVSINRSGTDSGSAPAGLSAERGSQNPVISRNGTRIAFTSGSDNLANGDTNNTVDVFVRDLTTNSTILASQNNSGGAIADNRSGNPDLSADGSQIVFTSNATNLIPNDTNGQQDVVVRDLQTGNIVLISRTPTGGVGNSLSGDMSGGVNSVLSVPVISGDGRFVVFASQATNLAADDNNALTDGFVIPVNPNDGNAILMSRRNSNPDSISRTGSGDSTSRGASVSADGRFVVFTSDAPEIVGGDSNGFTDVFLRDRQTGTTTLISRSRTGTSGNGVSTNASISADGRYMVFTSAATDLVTGDTNGAIDIFWVDRQAPEDQQIKLVSRSANAESLNPVMSSDGLFVAFTSGASNLVSGDTNGLQDVFIWNSQTDTVTVVSRGSAISNGTSEQAVISANGQYVAFVSDASNLVIDDTNGKKDVFVWDRNSNSITLVSRNTSGAIADGDSYQPSLSQNGRVIAFTSIATNLSAGTETSIDEDVFVRNLDTNTTVLASTNTSGGYSTGSGTGTLRAYNPVISGNGQFVAFTSDFGDLVATDTNGTLDVFLRDLVNNQTKLISINEAGTDSGNPVGGADGGTIGGFATGSFNPVISNDGRFVAFSSLSSNLVSNDTNNALDIFIRDTRSSVTRLVSQNSTETSTANNASFYPAISSNGTYVVFTSVANNLTDSSLRDLNGKSDVFGVNFAPSVSIGMISGSESTAEVDGTPTSARYRVRRQNQTAGALTVKLSIDAASTATIDDDFTITADAQFNLARNDSEITIVMPDGVTEAILTLTPVNDSKAEATETVVLNVVATEDYAVSGSGNATATITDSDTVVTTTNDSGEGSLRQAILNANANPGQDTIRFQIGTGTQTISLASALPLITDSIIIDGKTQSGYIDTPLITLNGTGAGSLADGLIVSSDNSIIQGLEIRGFAQNGVLLTSSSNRIEDNIITLNNGSGIAIDNIANNNRITKNLIFSNGQLEIDLGRDSLTANDTGDLDTGANNLQNKALIVSAEPSGSDAIVRGSFNGTPSSRFRVEFFSSNATDVSGSGEGQKFLDAIDIDTNTNGQATFNFTASDVAEGQFITATIIDANSNTSEFSNARLVAPPKVSISAMNSTLLENAGGTTTDFNFVVSLDQPSSQTVTVRVKTTNGTATSGSDYTAIDELITFSPQETQKPITVRVTGDQIVEPDETFTVTVTPETNAIAGTITSITATIDDDDEPPTVSIVNITPDSNEGNFGEKDYLFEIRLSNPASSDISVDYATRDIFASAGEDYISATGTVTFLASANETVKTIAIRGKGDTKFEIDETFNVELSNLIGTAQLDDTKKVATGTIRNDDPLPTLTITGAADIVEGQSGTTDYVFNVTLNEATSQPVTVDYTTIDQEATAADSDYVLSTGTLTFTPGTTSQQIIVKVNGDHKFENNERFQVQLSNPSGAQLGSQTSAIATISNDDTQPKLTIQANSTQAEGNSSSTPYEFVVSLSNPTDQTVTVNYTTENGTAIDTEDYASQTGTLTFAPGDSLSKTITVNVTGDTKRESNESFLVKLSDAAGATIDTSSATATIENDDPLPQVTVQSITANEGNNGNTPLLFAVSLSNPSDQAVTVTYGTENGTAIAAEDYEAATGQTITFAPGEVSKTIAVNAIGDINREANETFTLKLDSATNADIATRTATGTIQNDDTVPSLSITSASVDEGGVVSFVVNLSNSSNEEISANFATSDGTATLSDQDYTSRTGIITFAPGEVSKTITVQTTGDTKLESDETINLTLSNPTNATIATTTAIGTIRNDDQRPTIGIQADPSGGEGNRLAFTVTLSNPSDLPINVNYRTVDDTAKTSDQDYTDTSGTLTFSSTDLSLSKTIFVQTTDDNKFELDERFLVQLFNAVNADLSTSATEASGILTNDDSLPSISITTAGGSKPEGNSGDTSFGFEVSLSNPSSQTITVNYATVSGGSATEGTDFTPVTQTLTFNPGQDRQTITVLAKGDTVVENDEDFIVQLSNPTNATLSNIASEAKGIILNDDQPPRPTISIDDVVISEGNNGTNTYRFKVRLSEATSNQITVNYATSDDTARVNEDYLSSTGQLIFAAGELEKEVSVTVRGDEIFENDERFFVTLSNPTNADLSNLRSRANGVISNDDAKPKVTIGTATASEGESGTKDFVFNVELSNPSSQTINVAYETQDGTATLADQDYQSVRNTLTFAPGETQNTITVKVNGDRKFEQNETFSIRLTPDSNADLSTVVGQGVGTILPDDFRPTIAISSPTAINEGNNGTTAIAFPIQLSNPSSETVSVNFTTRNGTATDSDSDYGNSSGSITFAPGETSKVITIQAFGDTRYELNETFTVELSNPAGASLDSTSATATILNDDPLPQLRITANPTTQPEGNSALTVFTFEISLSEASPLPISVTYNTLDGTATTANNDYVAATQTITFAPGELRKTITINTLGDTQFESNETFQVSLSSSTNATVTINSATATIENDDTPPPETGGTDTGIADVLWRNQRTGENLLWLTSNTVFDRASSFTAVPDPRWTIVGVANFDGDSDTDILWRNTRTGENAVWLMQDNQLLAGIYLPSVADSSWEVKGIGDVNNDRKSDILWRNSRTGENAVWLMNDVTVSTGIYLPHVPDTSWTIEGLGDFDNDGDSDLFWYNNRTGETALWQMNNTQLGAGRYLIPTGDLAWRVEGIGDFNNDRFLDVLWRNQRTGQQGFWLLKNGLLDRVALLPTVADTSWQIEQVADFNGDQNLDLLWRNYRTFETEFWFLNGEQFGIRTAILRVPDNNWAIEGIGSFGSDRKPAILWRNQISGDNGLWFTSNNTFTRTLEVDFTRDRTWTLQDTGDFNSDGEADTLWRNSLTGEVELWFTQNGQVRNKFALSPVVSDPNWVIEGVGDFNRDRNLDILWRHRQSGHIGAWLLNQGRFESAVTLSPSSDVAWKIVGIADFNGDQSLDLLWRHSTTGDLGVWLLNRTTVTQQFGLETVDPTWQLKTIADFNRDGQVDFLWQNSQTGASGIWFMTGTRRDRATSWQTPAVWQITGVGDFNRDGHTDILWRHIGNGDNAVWYMNSGDIGLINFIEPLTDLDWQIQGIDDF